MYGSIALAIGMLCGAAMSAGDAADERPPTPPLKWIAIGRAASAKPGVSHTPRCPTPPSAPERRAKRPGDLPCSLR